MLEKPPYLPDLTPCDFFMFPKLKGIMKGICFPDVEAIKIAVTKELRVILDRSFQEYMEAWQRRMPKCVKYEGDHFEGDMLQFTTCIWNKRFMRTVSLLLKHTSHVLASPTHLYMPQLFTHCLPTIICVMLMSIVYVL